MINYTTQPKWKIGNYIREVLMGNAELKEIIGENIYPIVAPEGIKGEFLVYNRGKYTKSPTKMGIYQEECIVYILAVSDNYDTAIKMAELIDATLTGEHLYNNDRIQIDLEDSSENFQELKYVQSLSFRIR